VSGFAPNTQSCRASRKELELGRNTVRHLIAVYEKLPFRQCLFCENILTINWLLASQGVTSNLAVSRGIEKNGGDALCRSARDNVRHALARALAGEKEKKRIAQCRVGAFERLKRWGSSLPNVKPK